MNGFIKEGSKAKAPFEVILVWKFSRFTRKREHAVAFKSQLRRKGIRVVSITEQAEDNATGRLLEGIIESVDEFYSENLAQEVVRGMREAASRGFFLGSKAPFGYRKVKVSETSELTLEVLSPRIMSLRHREEQLEAAREDAETRLEQRRVALPDTEEIVEYVADFRDFLKKGTIPERKALIRNFVEGIEVNGDEAVLTYTVPMPSDGVTRESASVLDFVQSSPPCWSVLRTAASRSRPVTFEAPIGLSSGMGTV